MLPRYKMKLGKQLAMGNKNKPTPPQWHGLCHKLAVTYVQALKFQHQLHYSKHFTGHAVAVTLICYFSIFYLCSVTASILLFSCQLVMLWL